MAESVKTASTNARGESVTVTCPFRWMQSTTLKLTQHPFTAAPHLAGKKLIPESWWCQTQCQICDMSRRTTASGWDGYRRQQTMGSGTRWHTNQSGIKSQRWDLPYVSASDAGRDHFFLTWLCSVSDESMTCNVCGVCFLSFQSISLVNVTEVNLTSLQPHSLYNIRVQVAPESGGGFNSTENEFSVTTDGTGQPSSVEPVGWNHVAADKVFAVTLYGHQVWFWKLASCSTTVQPSCYTWWIHCSG